MDYIKKALGIGLVIGANVVRIRGFWRTADGDFVNGAIDLAASEAFTDCARKLTGWKLEA